VKEIIKAKKRRDARPKDECGTPKVPSQEQAEFVTSFLDPDQPLLTTQETAKMLGTTAGTLNVWRCTKRYALAYIKVGSSVRYRRQDVLDFINTRRIA
jgi:hypothetical protein